jgi:hypothetical protein
MFALGLLPPGGLYLALVEIWYVVLLNFLFDLIFFSATLVS